MARFESGKTPADRAIERIEAESATLRLSSDDEEDDAEEFEITGMTMDVDGEEHEVVRPTREDFASMEDELTDPAMKTETMAFHVDSEVAEKTFRRVADEIDEARCEGVTADEIVLGVEQYKAVCIHMNNNSMGSETVEEVFGLEVIVVPGPMIFVPRNKRRMLFEYGRE